MEYVLATALLIAYASGMHPKYCFSKQVSTPEGVLSAPPGKSPENGVARDSAPEFIRMCLILDLGARPSASELLEDK